MSWELLLSSCLWVESPNCKTSKDHQGIHCDSIPLSFASALACCLRSQLWQAHGCPSLQSLRHTASRLTQKLFPLGKVRNEKGGIPRPVLVTCSVLCTSRKLATSLLRQRMTHGLRTFVKSLSLCVLKGRKLVLMVNKTSTSKAFLCNLTCCFWRDRCVRNQESQMFPPYCLQLGKLLWLWFGFGSEVARTAGLHFILQPEAADR